MNEIVLLFDLPNRIEDTQEGYHAHVYINGDAAIV